MAGVAESLMNIGGLDIQPISVFLPDDPAWMAEYKEGKKYFASHGIHPYYIEGIHSVKWGLQSRHIYLLDGKPEQQWYIGESKVGTFLSWYVIYHVCRAMNRPYYLILESDCKFVNGWREKLEIEMQNVPADFDFLFVGSCCTKGKEPTHIKGDVYYYPYRGEAKWDWFPVCGHCYIIAHKAMQTLIDTQRDVANPVDVSLIKYAFPKLNIYAILPRLADQGDKTFLPE